MAYKKDIVVNDNVIKVVKLEYPALTTTSTQIHTFLFPTDTNGYLDEAKARKLYSNYSRPDMLERALDDARKMNNNIPSELEEKVEEKPQIKRQKGKIV